MSEKELLLDDELDDELEDKFEDKFEDRKKSVQKRKSYDLPLKHTEFLPMDNSNAFYIIIINGNALEITIKWLIELFQNDDNGYGRFIINIYKDEQQNDIILQIGASIKRINSVAHAIQLKQLTEDESVAKTFQVTQGNLYNVDSLSYEEKQKVILHELENVSSTEKGVLFGYPQIKLYPGQSILQVCHRENVIKQYFPLHQQEKLDELRSKWCFQFKKQPFNLIRNYFGEKITFYFAFLQFYTDFLKIPSILGLVQWFIGGINPWFSIFNMIWVIIFLKRWKRRQNELAFEWGTIGMNQQEGPRPTFRGKSMSRDSVTGQMVPIYPIYKTWFKEYVISLPLVLVSLYLSFKVMIIYFKLENDLIKHLDANPNPFGIILVNIPGIIYALIVMLMNHIYRKLATRLNEWENHRTQTSHENHWIIKLVLFEFINNFMSFFYVGFYLNDLSMLKWQIATLLLVYQVVDNIQEVLFPMITTFRFNRKFEQNLKKSDQTEIQKQIDKEKSMQEYEGTYYDYLELFIQFGYVFLFITVFPLGPVFALFNNFIEVKSDAFKLCYGFKRPHQRSSNQINGGWMKSFEVMALISVVTNCALITMSESFTLFQVDFITEQCQSQFSFVVLEHFIFSIILLISYIVPDVPKHVNVALMKEQHDVRKSEFLSTKDFLISKFE